MWSPPASIQEGDYLVLNTSNVRMQVDSKPVITKIKFAIQEVAVRRPNAPHCRDRSILETRAHNPDGEGYLRSKRFSLWFFPRHRSEPSQYVLKSPLLGLPYKFRLKCYQTKIFRLFSLPSFILFSFWLHYYTNIY